MSSYLTGIGSKKIVDRIRAGLLRQPAATRKVNQGAWWVIDAIWSRDGTRRESKWDRRKNLCRVEWVSRLFSLISILVSSCIFLNKGGRVILSSSWGRAGWELLRVRLVCLASEVRIGERVFSSLHHKKLFFLSFLFHYL